ncbi:hypothetical protein [Enterovirga aerilata]|uniref:O-antigen ligase like membrane protein n=1 Tax=Enterovirga aerilata TaxID=2730920 RepID=A0A849I5G2_9HYPH|nr:hypothetical protein [Enterovirga sp. DB1703]NNM71277.1 hypothetical protein [Enterovirga sp. DB1703]
MSIVLQEPRRAAPTSLDAVLASEPVQLILKLSFHLLLVSDLVFSSRLNRALLHPSSQQLTLAVLLACIALALVLAYLSGHLIIAGLSTLTITLLFFQIYLFSKVSGFGFLVTAGFQFLPVQTFIFFFIMARCGLLHHMLEWACRYFFLYSIAYLALSLAYSAGVLPAGLMAPVTLFQDERGLRLYHYGSATAVAYFYWLHRWRSEGLTAAAAAGIVLCAAAILISLSRVFILLTGFMTLLYLVRMPRPAISALSVLVFGTTSLVLLAGILDPSFNPFSALSADSSGTARAIEFEVAQDFLRESPLLGVGLAPTPYEVGFATGNYFFAASDLGLVGVWWDFGLLGMLLFVTGALIACSWNSLLGPRYAWPFFLSGCLIAAYGCISPTLFYPGGATVFALILGLWLYKQHLLAGRG